MKFVVEKPNYNNLPNHFAAVYKAFRSNLLSDGDEIDLSGLEFVNPLTILPIATIASSHNCKVTLPKDSNASSYLTTIHFPRGVESVAKTKGSYIPIGHLIGGDDPTQKERLESGIVQLIRSKLSSDDKIGTSPIAYPISEIVTNIFDHSASNEGWILGQYYERKKHLELCILDRGQGLAKSYLNAKSLSYSDKEALERALSGESAKMSKERGYGLRTSRNLISSGLGGQVLIYSGTAGFLGLRGKERIFELPDFNWQGVIVAFCIPTDKNIDIAPYLE